MLYKTNLNKYKIRIFYMFYKKEKQDMFIIFNINPRFLPFLLYVRCKSGVGRNAFLSGPHLCFIIVFICDLFVSRDDPLMS